MKTQRESWKQFFWYVSLKIVYLYHKSAVCYVLCDSKLGFSVSIVLQPALWGWMSMCSGSLITLEMTIAVTVLLSHRHVSWSLGPSLCSTASSSRRVPPCCCTQPCPECLWTSVFAPISGPCLD